MRQEQQRTESADIDLSEVRGPNKELPTDIELAQAKFRELPKALEAATTLEEVKAVVQGLVDVVGLVLQSEITEQGRKERALEKLHAGFPSKRQH